MIFLAQFGINKHCKFSQRPQIAILLVLEKFTWLNSTYKELPLVWKIIKYNFVWKIICFLVLRCFQLILSISKHNSNFNPRSFWELSFKNWVSGDSQLTFEHYWQLVVWFTYLFIPNCTWNYGMTYKNFKFITKIHWTMKKITITDLIFFWRTLVYNGWLAECVNKPLKGLFIAKIRIHLRCCHYKC